MHKKRFQVKKIRRDTYKIEVLEPKTKAKCGFFSCGPLVQEMKTNRQMKLEEKKRQKRGSEEEERHKIKLPLQLIVKLSNKQML